MSTSTLQRRYTVLMYVNTLYRHDFDATSSADAIAQAKALYNRHDTAPFEDCGSEPDLWDTELADQ